MENDHNSTSSEIFNLGRSHHLRSLGIQDIDGYISKRVEFNNGVPVSVLRISLDNVMPEDLEYVFSIIRREAESVSGDLKHASASIEARRRHGEEQAVLMKDQYKQEARKALGYS